MVTFTIVTATYNAAITLSCALQSVCYQGADVEHIVIDGASTDKTMEVVDSHQKYLSVVISEPDKGLYDAMNKGIRLATGEVVGILNADDYYTTNDVLRKVATLFADPKIDAVYGDLVYVDSKDGNKVVRYWKSGQYAPSRFYWGWMPPHPTFFVRRVIYEKYGLFNLQLGSAADYEIMLRFLLKRGIEVAYLPNILVCMRVGGVSNSGIINRLKATRMDRRAWIVNGLKPYPWTLGCKPLRKIGQWFITP